MLILKFWIKTSNGRVYVEVPAKINDSGSYKDKEHIFTETGMIPRCLIEGKIKEDWTDIKESGPDSQPLLFLK